MVKTGRPRRFRSNVTTKHSGGTCRSDGAHVDACKEEQRNTLVKVWITSTFPGHGTQSSSQFGPLIIVYLATQCTLNHT